MDQQACLELTSTAIMQFVTHFAWPFAFFLLMIVGAILVVLWPRKPVIELLLTQDDQGHLIQAEVIKDGWNRVKQANAQKERTP